MSEQEAVADVQVEEPVVVPRQKTDQDTNTRPKKQPPYAVVVHNDELHTWPYVIDVLQRVCGHNKQRAYQLTSAVHNTGKAIVWSGTLEVAELKRDQIRGFGTDHYAGQPITFPLGVTLEPLPVD
jgi:ATP-dependent Clp protease adaptor protein ClpS